MNVWEDDEFVTVAVVGDIDPATAPAFRRALTEALTYRPPLIVIDLRDAGCFGSTAISCLVPLARDAAERDIRIDLVNPSPLTRQVLTVSRITELPSLHLLD